MAMAARSGMIAPELQHWPMSEEKSASRSLLDDDGASGAINGNAAPGGNALCCSLHADDRRDAILAGNDGPLPLSE